MKLLASDFDNTLWFNDHMKDNDVKNIKEFQKHGNLLVYVQEDVYMELSIQVNPITLNMIFIYY